MSEEQQTQVAGEGHLSGGDSGTAGLHVAADSPGMASSPPPASGGTRAERLGEPLLGRLERLSDVSMVVAVELGRTTMLVKELLNLRAGSLVELDRQVGSPVDVLVNGTPLARGEVVVVDDELGVRLTEILGAEEE